jgi:hypothetical protein
VHCFCFYLCFVFSFCHLLQCFFFCRHEKLSTVFYCCALFCQLCALGCRRVGTSFLKPFFSFSEEEKSDVKTQALKPCTPISCRRVAPTHLIIARHAEGGSPHTIATRHNHTHLGAVPRSAQEPHGGDTVHRRGGTAKFLESPPSWWEGFSSIPIPVTRAAVSQTHKHEFI